MPMMISDTPLFVAYGGPTARFEPSVERFVRDSLVKACEDAGARVIGDAPTAPAPTPVGVTDEQIQAAIQSLMEAGKTSAFGADGRPKVRAIEAVLDANIDAADRDRVWEHMNG